MLAPRTNRLGIIAGGGALPRRLRGAARTQGSDVFVLGLEGQAEKSLAPDAWVRLGATDRAIDILKKSGADTLVMAGHVRRPALSELRPDLRTVKLFAKLGTRALGDDNLLRAIAAELEGEGFKVIGAHMIDQTLLAPAGHIAGKPPTAEQQADIARGIEVAKNIGRLDIGQAVVVQQGIVLAIEAVEGTDQLLKRCAKLRRAGQGGVLVKACKPQQDKRLDLPTIGLRTLTQASLAGLAGIAVEAGASLLLDREELADTANRLGLFITGFEVS